MAFRPAGVIAGFFDLAKSGFTPSERRALSRAIDVFGEGSRVERTEARLFVAIEAASWEDHASLGSVNEAKQVARFIGSGSKGVGEMVSKCDNKCRPATFRDFSLAMDLGPRSFFRAV